MSQTPTSLPDGMISAKEARTEAEILQELEIALESYRLVLNEVLKKNKMPTFDSLKALDAYVRESPENAKTIITIMDRVLPSSIRTRIKSYLKRNLQGRGIRAMFLIALSIAISISGVLGIGVEILDVVLDWLTGG